MRLLFSAKDAQAAELGGQDLDDDSLWDLYRPPIGRLSVRSNFVSTIDGTAAFHGRSAPLSSPADRALFKLLRAQADLIVVGASTFAAEHYGPVRLPKAAAERRLATGKAPTPRLAILSRTLNIDLSSPIFGAGEAQAPLIITVESAPEQLAARVGRVAEVKVAGEHSIDWNGLRGSLSAEGVESVLCEGGPTTFGSLVAAGALDELCITVRTSLLGAAGPRLMGGTALGVPFDLATLHILQQDSHLFFRLARS